MKIFVVDDEPNVRLTLKIALQKEGFEVVQCINGKDALDKLSDEKPDLIILDYNMPIMDGFSFLAAIRERKYIIPVIFLSDYADIETKIEGLNLGADDYLGKPFSTKELIARINVLLRRYNLTAYASHTTESKEKILGCRNISLNLLSLSQFDSLSLLFYSYER